MELIDPDFTGLYAIEAAGSYRVIAFDPPVDRQPGWAERQVIMSEAQYLRFEADRLLLNGLLAIEEAYDVMMGNYLDLEETVLRLAALELSQRRPKGIDPFDTARRSCHRALANLLSASRAFQDHSQRLASSIGGAAGVADLSSLKASFSRAYDHWQGFRFMSALRNHAQHYGVSVSGVYHIRSLVHDDGSSSEQYVTTTPYLRLSDLQENDGFKSGILDEIAAVAQPDPRGLPIVPIIPMARQYVAGLSSVITDIRAHYREREEAALQLLYSAFYHYTGFLTKGAPIGFHVAPEPNPEGSDTYFGTGAHFQARTLREVNGELSLLPLTSIRQ